jgi:hypothetical protein
VSNRVPDLAAIALALPGVTEGVACAGTALESRTFGVGKRVFLFLSPKESRLKLGSAANDARALGFEVGANGWIKVANATQPGVAVLRRWIAESYEVVCGPTAAPKKASMPRAKAKASKAISRRKTTRRSSR